MPRRALTTDEKLARLQTEIENLQTRLAEKEKDYKELQQTKKEETMKQLAEAIDSSGKTVADVLQFLSEK